MTHNTTCFIFYVLEWKDFSLQFLYDQTFVRFGDSRLFCKKILTGTVRISKVNRNDPRNI